MKNMNFTPNFFVVDAKIDTAAGTGNANAEQAIDVSQADCVTVIVELGSIVDGGSGSVQLVEADSNLSTYTPIPGASIDFVHNASTDNSHELFILEVVKPTKPWMYARVTRNTENTTVHGGVYIIGGLRYTQSGFDNYKVNIGATTDNNVKMIVAGEDSNTHTNPSGW